MQRLTLTEFIAGQLDTVAKAETRKVARSAKQASRRLRLSKSIYHYDRRPFKPSAAFGSEQCERDYLNSDITRYYACNRS